jgi:hypothetical protein
MGSAAVIVTVLFILPLRPLTRAFDATYAELVATAALLR